MSEGSGKNAPVEGYEIGGKTATSQTFPRSDNIYIASFLGFYPADDPQIMFLVKINNPKDAYYGGTIATPVATENYLRRQYRIYRPCEMMMNNVY